LSERVEKGELTTLYAQKLQKAKCVRRGREKTRREMEEKTRREYRERGREDKEKGGDKERTTERDREAGWELVVAEESGATAFLQVILLTLDIFLLHFES